MGKGEEARFVYENEVQKWLDLIRGSYLPSNIDDMKLGQDKRPPMPYSDTRLLNVLSHTLWFLPNVASCQAMYNLMMQKQNAWFNQRYTINVCAGTKAPKHDTIQNGPLSTKNPGKTGKVFLKNLKKRLANGAEAWYIK